MCVCVCVCVCVCLSVHARARAKRLKNVEYDLDIWEMAKIFGKWLRYIGHGLSCLVFDVTVTIHSKQEKRCCTHVKDFTLLFPFVPHI